MLFHRARVLLEAQNHFWASALATDIDTVIQCLETELVGKTILDASFPVEGSKETHVVLASGKIYLEAAGKRFRMFECAVGNIYQMAAVHSALWNLVIHMDEKRSGK